MGELVIWFLLKAVAYPFVHGWNRLCLIVSTFFAELFAKERLRDKIFGILPGLSVVFGIFVCLYSIITFAIDGGYSEVIKFVKVYGFFSDEDGLLVSGNAGNFYLLGISWVFVALTFIQMIYVIVIFLRNSAGVKRVIFSIFATITAISTILLLTSAIEVAKYVEAVNMIDLEPEIHRGKLLKQIEEIVGMTGLIDSTEGMSLYVILVIADFVSLAVMYIFLRFDENCGFYALEILGSAYVNIAFLPLMTLVLENVIGLGVTLLGFLIIFIAIMFVGGTAIGDLTGGESIISSGSSEREECRREERINYLENRINANAHGLREARKGTIGYGHVDEKVTKNCMMKDRREIEMLKKQKCNG